MIEILSPCGSQESVTAAINSGADSIYVGAKDFSARKTAENFTSEQLQDICRLSHSSGLKVYLALNTIVYNSEFKALQSCIYDAAQCGADAVIVQDLGVFSAVREICPQMPVHASTQMTITSLSGAVFAKNAGFKRIVLARELSFKQIKEITQNVDIETEVFVHGAHCVSLSGQCYMSALFGSRSGNRGLCAQPCRLDFSHGNQNNILSLKDLSLIDKIKELESIGVTSVKIEGRLKRPEYVAAATHSCVLARDLKPFDKKLLEEVFSRSGFTDGYFKDDYKNMQGIRRKEDVVSAPKVFSEIKELYRKPYKRYKIDIFADINEDYFEVSAKCGNIYVNYTGLKPEKAINKEIDENLVNQQLSKFGGTIFEVNDVSCEIQSGLMLSASALNAARREIQSMLEQRITEQNSPKYEIKEISEAASKFVSTSKPPALRVEIETKSQLSEAVLCDYEYIYAPYHILDEKLDKAYRSKIIITLPVFLADCEEKIKNQLKQLKNLGYTRAKAHTAGHIELIKSSGFNVHGGFRLNTVNSKAVEFFEKQGLEDNVLSVEINVKDANEMPRTKPVGIVAYGNLPVMTLRRCPVKGDMPCQNKDRTRCEITDRLGNKFKTSCSNTVELLNPDTLILSDKLSEFTGLDFIILKLTDESPKEIFDMYKYKLKPSGKLTRGLYFRV